MITEDGSKEINIICSNCYAKAPLALSVKGATSMCREDRMVQELLDLMNKYLEEWNERGRVELRIIFGDKN